MSGPGDEAEGAGLHRSGPRRPEQDPRCRVLPRCSSRPSAPSMTTRRKPSRPCWRASPPSRRPPVDERIVRKPPPHLPVLLEYRLKSCVDEETLHSLPVPPWLVDRKNKRPDPNAHSVRWNSAPVLGPKKETVYATDAIGPEAHAPDIGYSDRSSAKEVYNQNIRPLVVHSNHK